MINCKMGVISLPRNYGKDHFINLGEVFDKTVRGNIDSLYEIHSSLRYLCPFNVLVNEEDSIPDNVEEFISFQQRYKLTRKIYINNTLLPGTYKYFSPVLYDLTCMVPLFPDTIPKCIFFSKNNKPIRLFILLPYSDPILRGNIIDNCMCLINDDVKGIFFALGSKHGNNTRDTCKLTRRYLLSCGVGDKNILVNQYDDFPDCIPETMELIDLFFGNAKIQVYLAISRDDITISLKHVRLMNKMDMLNRTLKFVCN